MSSNTRSKNRTDRSPQIRKGSPRYGGSPTGNRLYPDLPGSDDEDDESWVMSSPGGATFSTTMSSELSEYSFDDGSSPLGRSPIHDQDSGLRGTRLRSGRVYKPSSSLSDYTDQDSFSARPHSPRVPASNAKKTPKDNSLFYVIIAICLVLLSVCAFFVYLYLCGDEHTEGPTPDVFNQFKQQMSDLKENFPSQSSKSWKVLTFATKHILVDPNPVYPAVILMAGSTKSSPVMTCIARQMVTMLNQLYNVSHPSNDNTKILVSDLNHGSPAVEKLDLDTKLHKIFATGNKGAILVNIEHLSPDAALMLHSYCDNDNAPYKNVLIILQVVSDSVIETTVEHYLQEIWEGHLGVDRVMALLSRIANNIISVVPEESSVLDAVCS